VLKLQREKAEWGTKKGDKKKTIVGEGETGLWGAATQGGTGISSSNLKKKKPKKH